MCGTPTLSTLVATSEAVASTRSRLAKRDAIAELLTGLPDGEVALGIAYLAGAPRQDRLGVGWATVAQPEATASEEASLSLADVDAAFDQLAATAGAGSKQRRLSILADLFGAATAAEQDFLRRLLLRNLTQGATEGVMVEALAQAAGVPADAVRRAVMLSGSLVEAGSALINGGASALDRFRLTVGVPLGPMLAATAPDVATAMATFGEAAVERKLDGMRIQAHRSGGTVRLFTRNLNDVTGRLPEVAAQIAGLHHDPLILDGEILAHDGSGRPLPFQTSMSRFGTGDEGTDARHGVPIGLFVFDALHIDGTDLVDLPARERWTHLSSLPEPMLVPRIITADVAEAEAFAAATLAAGHEGVMVKDPGAPYAAGRRGTAWLKVKPAHTLDLVVLAVEWGSGRRHGKLSNIHLGARSGDGFVMLGKTFKGMTDAMLAWQTERFLALETHRSGHVVHVRPEQVVEIAFDGIQASTRYPGGMALRFARVKRYRDDKTAAEADTIDTVRALHTRST